jgi:hypothetical protein
MDGWNGVYSITSVVVVAVVFRQNNPVPTRSFDVTPGAGGHKVT